MAATSRLSFRKPVGPGFRGNPAWQTALSGIHLSACAVPGMDSGSQGSHVGTLRVPGSPNARNDKGMIHMRWLWHDLASCPSSPERAHSFCCQLPIFEEHRTRWTNKRSEEHTSELQSLMRNSYAVFCLKQKQ